MNKSSYLKILLVAIFVILVTCLLAFAANRLLTGEGIYRHIEWPVVVMLGAMIPIGHALTSSGLTQTIAEFITLNFSGVSVVWLLVIVLVVTMFISDLVNNAATALIMAPIAVQQLQASNMSQIIVIIIEILVL